MRSALAIYVRDDLAEVGMAGVGLDDYEAVGAAYPATGYFWNAGIPSEWCTGTIVHYQFGTTFVLTAAHCVRLFDANNDQTVTAAEGANLSFQLGNSGNLNGPGFGILMATYPSTYTAGVRSDDVAVVQINAGSGSFGSAIAPFSFTNPADLVGSQADMVGWGNQGTGLAHGAGGPPRSVTDGFGYTAKDKLGAQNIIDTIFAGLFVTDFDDPLNANGVNPLGSAFPLSLEGTTAGGDSGGPLIPIGLAPGSGTVVGVLSGGLQTGVGPGAPSANCTLNSLYNDCSAWAPLHTNRAFIASNLPAPEPSTLVLLCGGLAGFAARGRLRRRAA
jgi:hypothetical protein